MLLAPVVACEISEPPTTPRGTSRSGPGLTTFMSVAVRRVDELVEVRLLAVLRRLLVEQLESPVVERLEPLVPGDLLQAIPAVAGEVELDDLGPLDARRLAAALL